MERLSLLLDASSPLEEGHLTADSFSSAFGSNVHRLAVSTSCANDGSDAAGVACSDEEEADDFHDAASGELKSGTLQPQPRPLPALLLPPLLLSLLAVAIFLAAAAPARREAAAEGPDTALDSGIIGFSESPQFGIIEGIYTYGAPGTAATPLPNLQREDRCFGGLRSFNEDVLGPATKEEDAAALSNLFAHARMPTIVLRKGADSDFEPCKASATTAAAAAEEKGEEGTQARTALSSSSSSSSSSSLLQSSFSWPNDKHGDEFADWGLHWENDYTPRLANVRIDGKDMSEKDPFHKAWQYVLAAYKTYDSTAHAVAQLRERVPSWRLVATETRIEGQGSLYDEDPVLLVQDIDTLDCGLVFTGTNNVDNELTTSITNYGTGYCGFSEVHAGYRNELWSIAHDLFPRLRPKLSKCRKVDCVGHSLGGSLCEIFSACANSGRTDDPDFQNQMWVRGVPELMDGISKGGVVYVDDAEHRCAEPPCPKVR